MRDLFNAIDTDGSGTITHEEMMKVGLPAKWLVSCLPNT